MTETVTKAAEPAGMRVLFATAELRPLVSAGGLGEASAGLVAALREAGVDVTIALPDYFSWELSEARTIELGVADWAAPATARLGVHSDAGKIALISVPGIERPDPYVDADGEGWPDNTDRFAAFGAAIAALQVSESFDAVHLNDWHTALAPAFMGKDAPTMLTIHNLGHQGQADGSWLHRLPTNRDTYSWGGELNPLAGAIGTARVVSTVSPNYADEILTEADGMGLHTRLGERTDALVGIRNGIDVRSWNPETDPHIAPYSVAEIEGKDIARSQLLDRVGWSDTGEPLVVMVTRLVEQKGVDLAFEAARFLEGMRARMIVLGSGERRLADWARWLQEHKPDHFWFYDGYDVPLSHQLFAGGDLLLMPSRFEPCGLAQMQAMAYGTLPVVTAVGGLADTVVDADASSHGNGIVATTTDESGIVDALHRGVRAHRHHGRRRALQRRGMSTDWSWSEPAKQYVELYRKLRS